ncbi:hypothetical protein [Ruania rhizosphaerae]|uniref:hypothetical protein n=1 Tax=Ruania rhizosphaerae TaxID=1840413 RepID=UPI0013570017|nr:hypothetical protein [Ruania rhizosphaerae]
MSTEKSKSLVLLHVHSTSEEGRSFQLSARCEVSRERPTLSERIDGLAARVMLVLLKILPGLQALLDYLLSLS